MDGLLDYLRSLLGAGKSTVKDNYIFSCPVCKHKKPKLEIDIRSGFWHCWVCDRGGKSIFTLLKWIGSPKTEYARLGSIIGDRKFVKRDYNDDTVCVLPEEYTPLWVRNDASYAWRSCMNYLRGRGVRVSDILKYHIGYCESGEYANMAIFPSYDRTGMLNYFTGRAFVESTGFAFKNPSVSKNIVGCEMFINWDEPVIFVEGMLDAIAVRINSIPLFGKTIQAAVKLEVLERGVKTIVMCLDSDAYTNALDNIEFFVNNGLTVKLVEMPPDEDPSSLGYEMVWKCIDSAITVDGSVLMRLKVNEHLYGKGRTHIPRGGYTRQVIR